MDLTAGGTVLIILGMLFIAIGLLVELLSVSRSGEALGAAVVFIGPIPLVFATDRRYAFLALIAGLAVVVVWLLISTLYTAR